MYKLVALDMDGTLLNSNKQISERNKQAIRLAQEKGTKVVLASGRPLEGMLPQLKELGLTGDDDFVICYNGSLVKRVSDGETVRQQILCGKDAKQLAVLAADLGVFIHAFSPVRGLITPQNNPFTDHEAEINGIGINMLDFAELSDDEEIIKTMLVAEPEILSKAVSALTGDLHEQFTVVQSSPFFLEFLNKQSNKGVGVQSVAELLNIERDHIICMGDAENDHHMIEYAGLGVAMENATEQTKALADYITVSNDDSGVAAVIEQFILD